MHESKKLRGWVSVTAVDGDVLFVHAVDRDVHIKEYSCDVKYGLQIWTVLQRDGTVHLGLFF